MSLARLGRRHGDREEARQALATAYGRYAEGLDLAMLRDAKSLLDELG